MEKIKNIALVSAAGSGKTHALTKRFLHLFLHVNNYPLETIYAITFTNAAAYEMKSRIIKYLGVLTSGRTGDSPQEKDVLDNFSKLFVQKDLQRIATAKSEYLINNLSRLNVSTFHSLFASFLSVIPFEAGILPEYRIIDETEEALMIEQAIDRYFELAGENKESTRAIMDLIEVEEKRAKKEISELYKKYQPWIPMILNILAQKDFWNKRAEELKEKVFGLLKKLRRFIDDNIEASYTQKGTINSNFAKFLNNIDEFIATEDLDGFEKIADSFVKDLRDKNYFITFRERLENPEQFETLAKEIKEEIIRLNEAISNCKIIIQSKPIVEIHRLFQQEKKKKNVITFSDIEELVYSVLSELKNNDEVDYLYFKLGSNINHLMIDEFQDTSYKQIDVLKPILDEILAYNPEEKSLFYVGDPHQAIFRWRQGAPELFEILKEDYKDKIDEQRLDKNYRSKEEIIKFVNRILDKDDRADPKNKGGWIRIENLGGFNNKDEGNEKCMNRVVEMIKELKAKGYKESEIAILVRMNEFGAKLSALLSKNNIPCLSRARASIMDEPDVQFIINLLKFLDNPEDDFSLFHILVSSVFNLSEETICNIKTRNKTLFLTLADYHPDWDVTKKLKELLSLVYFMNPYQLIFHSCNFLGIRISYPIASLLDAAVYYTGQDCGSLTDFINWIEQYGDTIESKETQFEGVRIMTIHKAKGLEFEVVILPETNWTVQRDKTLIFSYTEKAKPDKLYLRKYGKYIPGLLDREYELCEIDDLNLLYVALTRAKTGIWILGFETNRSNLGFWLEKIKEKIGEFPVDDIPERKIEVEEREKEKIYVMPAEKISPLREEREIYSPTERGIEIIEPSRRIGMKFGDIVHKVLGRVEWLDNLEIDDYVNGLLEYARSNYAGTQEEIDEVVKRLKFILREVFADPDLRFLFYKDGRDIKCKNELPIYFEDGKKDVSVHIDRILIEPDRITIIDYKTGTENPEYIHQMKVYKKGIKTIYPGMEIKSILVYLDNTSGNRVRELE